MTLRRTLIGLLVAGATLPACAQNADTSDLVRIRDAAMASDWGYQRLADLSDVIGQRLTGTPGAEAAVEQLANALRGAGVSVTLEPVQVTPWLRGREEAQLVSYAGRPEGVSQKVVLTTLGGSSATPESGITAPILIIHDFDELARRQNEVKGKIVLFDAAFDSELPQNGYSGVAYGSLFKFRGSGPSKASQLGALATLVRSLGGANYRLPHTGGTYFANGVAPIPCAAITAEDAMLIDRLSARGAPVVMHLTLTPTQSPEVESHNVIGEIAGTDPNAGIVLVSGHIDSWDLGTGAMDDGIGVIAAMSTMKIFKDLNLHPKRTIRFVGWMNEEMGLRGASTYAKEHKGELPLHMAAIESDFGIGKPLGIITNASIEAAPLLHQMLDVMAPLGAQVLQQLPNDLGSDLDGIQAAGVPIYEPLVDGRHYFDYHHTAADTFDKIDAGDLRRNIALMAVMTYFLANSDPLVPRRAMELVKR